MKIRLADFSDFIIFRLGFRLGADFAAWVLYTHPTLPQAGGRDLLHRITLTMPRCTDIINTVGEGVLDLSDGTVVFC